MSRPASYPEREPPSGLRRFEPVLPDPRRISRAGARKAANWVIGVLAVVVVVGGVAVTFITPAVAVTGIGNLEPARRWSITAPMPGTVREVLVASGDTVGAGSVVMRLDPPDVVRSVESAQFTRTHGSQGWRAVVLLTDNDAARISVGDSAHVECQACGARGRYRLGGVVSAIERAPCARDPAAARPGSRCRVVVRLDQVQVAGLDSQTLSRGHSVEATIVPKSTTAFETRWVWVKRILQP